MGARYLNASVHARKMRRIRNSAGNSESEDVTMAFADAFCRREAKCVEMAGLMLAYPFALAYIAAGITYRSALALGL